MPDSAIANRIFDRKHLRCTVFGTGLHRFATFDNQVLQKSTFGDSHPSGKIIAAGFQHVFIQTKNHDSFRCMPFRRPHGRAVAGKRQSASEKTRLDLCGHRCTGYIREAQVFGSLQDILLKTDFAATDIFQLKKSTWVRSPSYRFILTEYLNIRKSRPGSPQFAPDP